MGNEANLMHLPSSLAGVSCVFAAWFYSTAGKGKLQPSPYHKDRAKLPAAEQRVCPPQNVQQSGAFFLHESAQLA